MGRTWIDNTVIDAGLSCQALALYVNIKKRMCGIADADRNKYLVERDGVMCFSLHGVSVQELLKAAGISKNTFARFSQELVDAGFLMVDIGCLDGKKRKTNVYYIPVSMEEFKGQEMEEETVKAQTGGVMRQSSTEDSPLKQPTTKGFPKQRRKSREEVRKELEDTPHPDIREVLAKGQGYTSHADMVAKKEKEREEALLSKQSRAVLMGSKRAAVAKTGEWKKGEEGVHIGVKL